MIWFLGGWENNAIVDYFRQYSQMMFTELGPLVNVALKEFLCPNFFLLYLYIQNMLHNKQFYRLKCG